MILKLFDLISSMCPFPLIVNNKKKDGIIYLQPAICKNCKNIICHKNKYPLNTVLLCDKGYNFYKFIIAERIITINGIKIIGKCKKIPRKEKKKSISNITTQNTVESWIQHTNEMIKSLEKEVFKSVQSSLGMLHDVKTAVSIIFRNAESIIYEEPGDSMDEKIENAPSNKKKLYKSVSLLEERLKMMNLVSNPEAAKHGEKNPLPVYKVFDKTLKLYHSLASKKHIRLKLLGTSFSSPRLYSSFNTIPLVLIDNAIKYSQPYQEIIVTVKDVYGGVSVQVESYSLKIGNEDSEKIFQKNFRAKNAALIAREGSGLGLYLADIVAYANGFDINHTETGTVCMKDNLPYINNIFSLHIR